MISTNPILNKCIICFILPILSILFASSINAQQSRDNEKPWTLYARAVMSGNSYDSDPAGFKAYSGMALEAGIDRNINPLISTEIRFRTESREVDREVESGPADRLGSLELIPLTLSIKFHPVISRWFGPYLGFGANLTAAWEKSGVLDSLDVKPHFGPALQLGLNYNIGCSGMLNLDLQWNTLTSNIRINGERFAKIKIDPIAIGMGLGVRF